MKEGIGGKRRVRCLDNHGMSDVGSNPDGDFVRVTIAMSVAAWLFRQCPVTVVEEEVSIRKL